MILSRGKKKKGLTAPKPDVEKFEELERRIFGGRGPESTI